MTGSLLGLKVTQEALFLLLVFWFAQQPALEQACEPLQVSDVRGRASRLRKLRWSLELNDLCVVGEYIKPRLTAGAATRNWIVHLVKRPDESAEPSDAGGPEE